VTQRDHRVERLTDLYRELHAFAAPRDRGDTQLRRREPVARSLNTRLLLLAQGLAQSTQRVTGFPYRKPGGLSDAGRRLDAFLRPLGHTIDHTDGSRLYAYSTDLVPWYPGKDGKYDVEPTDREIAECWRFFEREVELVTPDAIVLLGRPATRAFLRRYAGVTVGRSKRTLEAPAGRSGGPPVCCSGRRLPNGSCCRLASVRGVGQVRGVRCADVPRYPAGAHGVA
jgi:uracil-DNA glycosylase